MRFDLGELFCGPGGMAIASTRVAPVQALGGETYTLRHAWGVDFSQPAIDTFNANLGGGICMDAWEFVRNHLDRQHRINALAFGFPCNSFSEVGERKGMDDPNFGKLYQTGIAVLDAYAPLWFVAENVSGISARDNGNQFRTILRELSLAGKGYDETTSRSVRPHPRTAKDANLSCHAPPRSPTCRPAPCARRPSGSSGGSASPRPATTPGNSTNSPIPKNAPTTSWTPTSGNCRGMRTKSRPLVRWRRSARR